MNQAAQVMRIYDQHVPGARDAYLNDQVTHYARSMMRHVLAIAEIAMRTEEIPDDTRFRILMTMAIGQPSTPVDAEMRTDMAKRLLLAEELRPSMVNMPATCRRCFDIGYVPDFSRGLNAEFGEPGKKPCPACQGSVARDESATERKTHRCDERCVCPIDGLPMRYAPSTEQHACQDPDCENAHPAPGPRSPRQEPDL